MGLFAKLFRRKSAGNQIDDILYEYKMAIECNHEFVALMAADKYIARSDYKFFNPKPAHEYTIYYAVDKVTGEKKQLDI